MVVFNVFDVCGYLGYKLFNNLFYTLYVNFWKSDSAGDFIVLRH